MGKRFMKTLLKTLIVLMSFWTMVFAADAVPLAKTAALVNRAVITTADYRSELARILRKHKNIEQELDSSVLAQTKKEALETLIGRELLYQESQREGISIQDAEVEAETDKLRKQFSTEGEFNASLGILELTKEAVETQIKHGMAIQALIDSRFSSKMAVKESELRNYYDNHQDAYIQPARIRLSHIMVKSGTLVTSTGKNIARTKIEDIYRRISEGEDFAQLVRVSEDINSSKVGGDLGYFTRGQLGKSLEAAAFSLEVGQVSTIIEDRFGHHILKVTERRPEATLPFDDVKERISKQLLRERMQGEVSSYLKQLRKAATVEIHLTEE